jgi:hypothetical protein
MMRSSSTRPASLSRTRRLAPRGSTYIWARVCIPTADLAPPRSFRIIAPPHGEGVLNLHGESGHQLRRVRWTVASDDEAARPPSPQPQTARDGDAEVRQRSGLACLRAHAREGCSLVGHPS